jgi:propionyl-CoA carboxylase beta chain
MDINLKTQENLQNIENISSLFEKIEKKRKITEENLNILSQTECIVKNKQNEKGKLTCLARLNVLGDFNLEKNFFEIGKFVTHQCHNFGMQNKKNFGDGVITGELKICDKRVFVASQDFLVSGGSVGYIHGSKIAKTLKIALDKGRPFIFMNDSGGARIQEGVDSLGGYGEIFHLNVAAHHKIPQISLILGPCAGGAVYSPALTDFVFMVKDTSYMYLTGPNIVKKVTFEDVNHETLGGASVHAFKSGVADLIFENDIDALNNAKILLSYLPNNCNENPPHNFSYKNEKSFEDNEYLNHFMPTNLHDSYDMYNLIDEIIDCGSFFEIKKHFAENLIIGFARIGGIVVGLIANQPSVLAGCLDIDASLKGEKFIRFCNAFNIPLVSLVDVPGFLPGTNQEYAGIINHGAKLLYAYSEAKVPKITVIVRKAYGGAYIVMNSKHLGADFNFAWPNAQIAVMGAEGAVELLVKEKTEENNQKFLKEYSEMSKPEYAGRIGFVDDIIEPSKTRRVIFKALKASLRTV